MSQGKPVTVLTPKNNAFDVDLNQIGEILAKCNDLPIAIYSVNGDSKTGKSYLLNIFVKCLVHKTEDGSDKGINWFEGDSTAKPVTAGIQMWSEPFVIKRPDGSQVALLLMDTQG